MKKLVIITLIAIPAFLFLYRKGACAEGTQCFTSPVPTDMIISPSPVITPTPTPIDIQPSVVASSEATEVPSTRIDTPASANNNAGQSATIQPTPKYIGPTLYDQVGWK